MKTVTRVVMPGLLALLLGSQRTSAQLVYLTDNRSVGVSESTNGFLVYGQTNYPTKPFASFGTNATGSAPDGQYDGVGSTASQISILSSNGIFVTNSIQLGYDYTLPLPNGGDTGDATAEATFDVFFRVNTPTVFTLTGREFVNGLIFPALATLSGFTTAPMNSDPWTYEGVLEPGITYELNADLGYSFLAMQDFMDSASVTTSIGIVVFAPPRITAVNVKNNALQLSVSSAPSSVNVIFATTNLALPISQWQPVSTNKADSSGVFHFTNSIAPGQNTQFYRISGP